MRGLAIFSGLAVFVAMHAAAFAIAGRVEYALDDVYIHLSIAGQIAQGGYGVNEGEIAAASSSILYPFLLTPFAGSEVARYVPILVNALAVVLAGLAWGTVLERAGWAEGARARFGRFLAVIGPVGLGWALSAFTGMENALHAAAALGVLAGLIRFVDTGRIGWLLPACVLLAPLLRYEGLGPALVAAGVVFVLGRRVTGSVLGIVALSGPVAFGIWLMGQGHPPLPASVMVKSGDATAIPLLDLRDTLAAGPSGLLAAVPMAQFALLAAGLAALVGAGLTLGRRMMWLALGIAAVAFAHLVLGEFGWLVRYEGYALAFSMGGVAALSARVRWALLRAPAELLVALVLIGVTVFYGSQAANRAIWSPQAIWLQQGQMAHIAREAVAGPVAVNDIGYVAWASPYGVLDLWGLASLEAAALRRGEAAPGWAGPLAEAAGAEVAMIYEQWLGSAIPETWQKLGELRLEAPPGYASGQAVSVYAVPDAAARIGAAIAALAEDLPAGAAWRPDAEAGPEPASEPAAPAADDPGAVAPDGDSAPEAEAGQDGGDAPDPETEAAADPAPPSGTDAPAE